MQFGRELNASDDRRRVRAVHRRSDARPIVEGKQIDPFRVSLDRCRSQLRSARDDAPRASRSAPRLAYRDVASATNRLTLIAAIIPARAVTTHTLFCLKTRSRWPSSTCCARCSTASSRTTSIRLRVNTHVTGHLMSRLPVPVIRDGDPFFAATRHAVLITRTRRRGRSRRWRNTRSCRPSARRRIELRREEFEHVLGTFPLSSATVR